MNYFIRLLSLMLIISVLFVSCDNSVNSDDDHSDAVGFVILQNNAEILRFQGNQFIYNQDGVWDDYFRTVDNEVVFTLSPAVIPDMDRGLTPSVFIQWIDQDGNLFDLPQEADGGEFRLEFNWEKDNTTGSECSEEARTSNLDQIRPSNLEQHGSDGSWGFHFRADHAGTDRIRFRLQHIDHDDLVSGYMTVNVAHDEHDQISEEGIYLHTRDKCRTR